jgi:hypothetical protein
MFNLAIIFGSRLIITNAITYLTLMFSFLHKKEKETKGVQGKEISLPEQEYFLLPYDEIFDSVRNYSDTAIQFGFMTLFVTALPIAPLLGLINGFVKVKMNSYVLARVSGLILP